jgi:hypothetical protein
MAEIFTPIHSCEEPYVSEGVVPHIAPELRELVRERTTEVLPALGRLGGGQPIGVCRGSH